MKEKFNYRLDPGQIEVPDEDMVKIYREKSPAERIKIVSDMWDSAWKQIECVLRSMHPDWSDSAINQEVIKRLSHNDNF